MTKGKKRLEAECRTFNSVNCKLKLYTGERELNYNVED